MGYFREKIGFYFTIENSRQNKASPIETPYYCVTPFINFKANREPSTHPENYTLFLSHKNTFITIENTYLSKWTFLEICLSIKEISILKS